MLRGAAFALLRKLRPSLLPSQVPTVRSTLAPQQPVQSTEVQVAVGSAPKDQETVVSTALEPHSTAAGIGVNENSIFAVMEMTYQLAQIIVSPRTF